MTLTVAQRGLYFTEEQWTNEASVPNSQMLELGEKLDYVAHVIGGMVKARRNGQMIVIHPGCTTELTLN